MHRSLILAACIVLLSSIGAKSALAEGDLQKVNHIIIVMQENHSFDNYLGLSLTPTG
jgi:phospholipase C